VPIRRVGEEEVEVAVGSLAPGAAEEVDDVAGGERNRPLLAVLEVDGGAQHVSTGPHRERQRLTPPQLSDLSVVDEDRVRPSLVRRAGLVPRHAERRFGSRAVDGTGRRRIRRCDLVDLVHRGASSPGTALTTDELYAA